MDTIKRDVGECDALNKSKIRDNKYSKMSGKEVVNLPNQKNLTKDQKKNLTLLLEEMKEVFQGRVGSRQGIKFDFKLRKDAKPKYSQP